MPPVLKSNFKLPTLRPNITYYTVIICIILYLKMSHGFVYFENSIFHMEKRPLIHHGKAQEVQDLFLNNYTCFNYFLN